MMHAALVVLAAAIARLPPAARARLGRALGFFVGSLVRVRRRAVEAAMARAMLPEPKAAAARMYESLGVGLVELLWLAGAGPQERDGAIADVTVDEDARAALEEATLRGPVVVFASHTGNWELAAAAAARLLAARGRSLVVVAKEMHVGGVEGFLTRLRARLGVRVIRPEGALGVARAALGAGDVIVMPIDQVPDRASHGVRVPFLGATAFVDRAPATLAWRARATVLVVSSRRVGSGHRVSLLEVIEPPGRGARPPEGRPTARAWIDAAAVVSTSRLEAFVRTAPESWLWLHRRWRAPHPFGRSRPNARHRAARIGGSPRPITAIVRSHAQ